MTWAEFQHWSLEALGYRIQGYWPRAPGAAWRAIWGSGTHFMLSRTETGSGNFAVYGPIQQRRLALWLRARTLVAPKLLNRWLDAGENLDSGWLVNDGSGIRWVDNPAIEATDLLRRGFIAVKCGL